MQHMHSNIPYMFDCWADPVVHLLPPTKELHGLVQSHLELQIFNQYFVSSFRSTLVCNIDILM